MSSFRESKVAWQAENRRSLDKRQEPGRDRRDRELPARFFGEAPEHVRGNMAWGASSVKEERRVGDQGSKFLPSTVSRRASRAIRHALESWLDMD
jgi:hypothetical protein